jgi:hypothetical protein
MSKGLAGFWKNFESTMSGLGKALEEEIDSIKTNAKAAADEMKSNLNGATSMSNTNGDIVITGDVKSLVVNGEKIELKNTKAH